MGQAVALMTGRPRKHNGTTELPVPETEQQKWLRILPKPPQPLYAATEGQIMIWLQRCAEAGGYEGLMWAYDPRNFPFDVRWRSHLQGDYLNLLTKLDDDAKRERERQAREQVERATDAAHEARKAAGWAR